MGDPPKPCSRCGIPLQSRDVDRPLCHACRSAERTTHIQRDSPMMLTMMRGGGVRAECHLDGWWTDTTNVEYAEIALDDHQINAHGKPTKRRRR